MDKVLISVGQFLTFMENLWFQSFLYKYFSSSFGLGSTFKWNLTLGFRFNYSKIKNLIMVLVFKIKPNSSLVPSNLYKKN